MNPLPPAILNTLEWTFVVRRDAQEFDFTATRKHGGILKDAVLHVRQVNPRTVPIAHIRNSED